MGRKVTWKRQAKGPKKDPARLRYIRSLPCAVGVSTGFAACEGKTEAHHPTHGRGMGQKSPDSEAFPLCMFHHKCFHDQTGRFAEMSRETRTLWQKTMSDFYRTVL